jgi:molybdate transport system substrate-binding protein
MIQRFFLIWAMGIWVNGAEVRVSAAASLTDALKEIAAAYQRTSRDKITFNFGASSFLARQMEAGAPADVFFSADEARMDELEKKNFVVKETRRSLLSNTLVIVVDKGSKIQIASADDLVKPEIKKIALADPATVPAGVYAKEYLEKINLWAQISKKIIPTDNVRAALAAVESGNVEAGIVYKTDAAISKKTRVGYEIPRDEGPAISYSVALLRDAKEPAAAREFLNCLAEPEASAVFRKFGFIVMTSSPK